MFSADIRQIRFENTIPNVTCKHLKVHYKKTYIIFSYPQQDLTGFKMFITKENYNVMKRYVTGCKHFWDPVLETEYNSFASQSDNGTALYISMYPKIN